MGDNHGIEESNDRSRMRRHGCPNDTVWTRPVPKITAKRRKLPSPSGDELPSRRPSPVLPDELIIEIFLRLPVKSLLQFRCVCKSWKTLISDPQFAKDHLRRSITDPNMTHQQLVSSIITKHCKILSCSVQSLFENPSTPAKVVSSSMSSKYHILGSCNGLLCLYDICQGCVRLWNPSTRLRSKASPRVAWPNGIITYHGFGYDQVNDKYKVLAVADNFRETATKIYTFGANSWTTVQNLPCSRSRWAGKFVSGTLNWITEGSVSSDQWVILSFDLERETYVEVLLPEQDGVKLCNPKLDVSNNCLCVSFYSDRTHFVLWMMKQYGVRESWTKLMMIPHEVFRISRWGPSFDPLCISKNGVVLVKIMSSMLVLYNSNNGRLDHPRIGRRLGLDLHIYHESLISPRC